MKATRKKRKPLGIRKGVKLTNLSHRLRTCMEHGNMTVRQLAWFFDRPYQTVYTWVYRNREPFDFYAAEVDRRLVVLERLVQSADALKNGKSLCPRDLRAAEREPYIRELWNRVSVSKRAAAS